MDMKLHEFSVMCDFSAFVKVFKEKSKVDGSLESYWIIICLGIDKKHRKAQNHGSGIC